MKSLLFVVIFICVVAVASAQDFTDELPRIPASGPVEALKAIKLADGFQIQLVASEPLVSSPVAIEWDADGRMFVCEMRGYSEHRDDRISRIALLTDTNDDGVYDSRTTFADELHWPTAIFPYDDGLFVGDAPDILYFKDTDNDGVADRRRVVLTGFGKSNVQGLMNSMRWGLDNRIHVAVSTAGGEIHRPIDQAKSDQAKSDQAKGDQANRDQANAVQVRGRDISFDPRTAEFQLTSGGGQHGMCFDDWGRKFVSSNSDHIQQVMYANDHVLRNPLMRPPPARLSIAQDGPQAEVFRISPVEPWRIVRTRLRVAGTVRGPIEGGGRAAGYFTGATGVTILRGDAWGDAVRGTAVVGDVGSNLVHRKRLRPAGVAMRAERIDRSPLSSCFRDWIDVINRNGRTDQRVGRSDSSRLRKYLDARRSSKLDRQRCGNTIFNAGIQTGLPFNCNR